MPNRRRGAALLFVLLLTMVMATMVGAFVGINRQQIALSSDTASRQQAYEACVSGLNWVQSQLEQQPAWGTSGFLQGQSTTLPGLTLQYHGDQTPDPDKNWVEGSVRSPGGVEFRFTVRVINQLEAYSGRPSTIGECPARSARVRIVGQSGGVSRRLDVVLRRRPFSDASMASGDNIDVKTTPTGDGWRMGTRDIANIVRANGTVSADSAIAGLTRFEQSRGQIKSHRDILLDGRSLSDASNAQYKRDSEAQANGTFTPSSKPVEIPDLSADDLKFPPDKIQIDPGKYVMRDYKYETYVDDPTEAGKFVKLAEVHRGLDMAGDHIASEEVDRIEETYGVDPADVGPVGWNNGQPAFQPVPSLGSVTVSGVKKDVIVDFTSGNILVPPGVTVEVQGTETLEFSTENGVIPTLAMGYEGDGYRPATVPASTLSTSRGALGQMEEVGAAITHKGSILLGGPILGLGSLNSDGDITFTGQTGLSVSPSAAVAVRAGRDLHLNAPSSGSLGGLRVDGPIFNSAMQQDAQWQLYRGLGLFSDPEIHKTAMERLGNTKVKDKDGGGLSAGEAWALMARETHKPPVMPGGIPFRGDLTLEQYVRLQKFMLSNSPTWLDESNPQIDLTGPIMTQVGAYATWASVNEITLEEFMAMGARIPEMWFRGLVYAGRDVNVNGKNSYYGEGAAFYNEGAVVAKGNIKVEGSPDISSMYNRLFLEDIVKLYRSTGVKLDAIFFNLQ